MSFSRTDAMTDLIIETFRLNGRLLAAGDSLVADIGLTSARWQVLGAVALSPDPLPVAHIAKAMGLARQSVQRLVNEMERDGLLSFRANPNHQRAKLVLLTPSGKAAYDRAMKRQIPWAEAIANGLSVKQIDAATAVLEAIRKRLEARAEGGEADA
jgi:DNA-binding MarR family transcriptional regulator